MMNKKTKYYALWHYSYCDGARSAHAISEHPETLIPLYEENIKNVGSQWYNYNETKIEPIECYTYHAETTKIEPYHDSHIANECDFYAFNTLCNDRFGLSFYDDIVIKVADTGGNFLDNEDYDDLNKGEILVYLSKNCHKMWQECSDRYREAHDTDNFAMDPNLPTFFYTDWPSHSPVETNVCYEEGIMNA